MFSNGSLLCDRFRVVRFIARGGMGELYEAEDLALGERVALKTIRAEIASDERVDHRFRREVLLARKVTHPNICRIFDLFQHMPGLAAPSSSTPTVFVTMELLAGETLAQRLRCAGALTVEQALPIAEQLTGALSAAHAVGVVHRDLKSSNIMLLEAERAGDPPRVVVTDFGLAHSLSGASVDAISATGELLGTPDYMAPEQIEGGLVTPATDIYALGIVLYEMVTGERPFAGDTPVASALRRLSGPPRSPRTLVPGLPQSWNRTIMHCLARDPRNRIQDAAAVIAALDSSPSAARPWKSQRLVVSLAAIVLVLAIAITWRTWPPSSDARLGDAAGNAPGAGAVVEMRPAVAVLGFRNLNGRADAQWLSVALAEMLTTELAAGETVRTIPGENVSRMKMELSLADADSYSAETLARIRQNLGTDIVVFGSYVTVGEGSDATLRVDLRLQDAREGRTVAQVSETSKAADLFSLLSRVGGRLRERVGGSASPEMLASAPVSRPASPEAIRLYAEGLTRLRRYNALGARELLEQAIEADPQYPLAYSALARTWSSLGYDNRARDAAARAFELAGDLPRMDRLQVEGTYREMSSAWKEAIAIWQALSTLFPDDVEHALRLANAQIVFGAAKDGLATIEAFRSRFPGVRDPRLDLAEGDAAGTLSDFKRTRAAAAAAAAAAETQGAQLLLAGARMLEGGAMLRQGETEKSVAMFEQAKRIYSDAGNRGAVANALNNLASAISDGPDTKRAAALYTEALGIARAIGDQRGVARLLNNLAIQERRSGNLKASLAMNQEALAIRREIGDRTNEAISLNNIGNVLLDLGDFEGASRYYEQSAAMSREIGDQRGLARTLHNAAETLNLQGEMARARATNEEALTIRRSIDDPASVATSLFGLGQTAAMQGDLATAKRALSEALEMDRRLDRRRPIAYSLYHLGEIALVEGDIAGARQRHQEALEVRTQLGEKGTAAESRAALAVLELEEGRAAEAEAFARDAAAIFAAQKAPDNEATARATMALAMLAQGRQGQAQREADRARALVPNPQHVLTRLSVAIAVARVQAATDPSAAVRGLDSLVTEAATRGIPRYGFEARRAIAQIESRRSPAAGATLTEALRKDAQAQGFRLYAR
jgi:tetratricopeptide (TPR) repeat protein/TolB-like protein/tRNA A-37 threonylcarbamoyl transferase component Bud32